MELREAFEKYQHFSYEVAYRDGFVIQVRPTSPLKFRQIAKSCTKITVNPKTRQAEEKLDEEQNRRKLTEHIIAGWSGLTNNKLRLWLPGLPLHPSDDEIPYDVDTALTLMDYLHDFERFLVDVAIGAYNIESERKETVKENFLP